MVNSMATSVNARRLLVGILIVLILVSAGWIVFSLIDAASKASKDRTSQSELNNLQSVVYDLITQARLASSGDEEAIAELPEIQEDMNTVEGRFNRSETELDTSERAALGKLLADINTNINAIGEQADNVVFLNDQLEVLDSNIPQVQQAYTTVVDTMLRTGVPADQVAEAQAQVWRAERLLTSLNRILIGADDPIAAAEQFRQDVLIFNQVLIGMKEGNLILGISRVDSPDTRLLLEQIETQFLTLNESIQSFIDASPSLGSVGASSDNILSSAEQLLQTISGVSGQVAELPNDFKKRRFSGQTTIIASVVLVLAFTILGALMFFNTKRNLKVTEETNETNQEAILRLLDEIADLGEGDLRVKATVSEDFTGAIADSINYAVEQLRSLVSNVANTAESVSASSNETRATSLRLSEASEHQARQVTEASESINEISNNLSKVSEDAEELADVAKSSVSVARNGAEVVQNTIDGMNNIREQIQDTSKRIKRLGESSQEIGDIVSLINEIADQTNILALNASIQAAMAGEAGRGFAVVADEVQGLAERAASSTKQIETLVKTIQSDTNEAVASMEQTTAEVVRGAQLANDAGSALNEIQSTSENLAKLILAIATETQDQSSNATRVVGTMSVIQDISSETLEGTTASAHAVGELAEQAQALRESISDFKLPEGEDSDGDSLFSDQSDASLDSDGIAADDEFLNLEEEVSEELISEDAENLLDSDGSADEIEELSELEELGEIDETDAIEEVEDLLNEDIEEVEANDDFGRGFDGDFEEDLDAHNDDDLEKLSESETDTENDNFDNQVFEDVALVEDDSDSVDGLEDDEDFSFSDDDFLTFDLDEEEQSKKA